MGGWTPATTSYHDLIEAEDTEADESRPYPFYLAYQLDGAPEILGAPKDWQAEWKWDGIRGQVILRNGTHHVWSRGEELMTDRFPEFARLVDFLPDGIVLDGEIVAWDGNQPFPFNTLQARIGRKTVPKKLLKDAPVILLAYDLLEENGQDLRDKPLNDRRTRMEGMLHNLPHDAPVKAAPPLPFDTWDALAHIRATARDHRAEGLMLKRQGKPLPGGSQEGRLVEMEA